MHPIVRFRRLMGSAAALYVPKTPSDFPNLGYWWRVEELSALANGDDVSSWPDKISGATLVQATAALKPHYITNQYNGLATVRFTAAASQVLNPAANPSFAGDFTAFVWYKSATVADSFLLGHSVATKENRVRAYVSGGQLHYLSQDDVAAANYDGTATSWASFPAIGSVVVVRRSGLNFRVHPNRRTYVQAAAAAANAWTISRVGRGSNYYNGDICEILLYSRYLSDAEITTLMGDYFYPRYNMMPYTWAQDYMTGYGAGSPVDGLNGGYGTNPSIQFLSPWIAPAAGMLQPTNDDFEAYSDADAVNGKTGGEGFLGAWVAR